MIFSNLKKLFQYLNKFYTDHFSWKEFIVALIFIVAFCFFKYYKYIPQYNGKISLLTSWWYEAYYKNLKFLFHFILYLSPLLIGYLVNSIVHRNWSFWKNPKFLALAIFGVLVFSFRSSISFFVSDWLDQHFNYAHLDWLNRIIGTIARGLFVFLVLFIYWIFTDKNNQPFYGFTSKGFDFKPYFIMLACMVPLIAAASTQTDFLTSYPRVQRLQSIDITIPTHWKFYAIYELLYHQDQTYDHY